jgi:adenylate cyclase
MIELEKTYLIKYLPENLQNFPAKEIIDIYIPEKSEHPKIRIRKNGSKFEITKKEPVNEGDSSHQEEQTIILTKEEFDFISKLPGKKSCKIRYDYKYENLTAEIDIFQENLSGLILVDFEFKTLKEKDSFKMPDFCLVDVTQEKFLAGGMLCGKSYSDIEENLKKFSYSKIA